MFCQWQASSFKHIICEVPQYSILGPRFFLLYRNEMPDCLKSTTPCVYADDTQIFVPSSNCTELIANLNSDLILVIEL